MLYWNHSRFSVSLYEWLNSMHSKFQSHSYWQSLVIAVWISITPPTLIVPVTTTCLCMHTCTHMHTVDMVPHTRTCMHTHVQMYMYMHTHTPHTYAVPGALNEVKGHGSMLTLHHFLCGLWYLCQELAQLVLLRQHLQEKEIYNYNRDKCPYNRKP